MTTTRRPVRALAALATTALVLGGCADTDDPDAAATSEPTDTATTEPVADPTEDDGDDAGDEADATITIADFAFGTPVTVPVGGTVEVVNADGVAHTWTADDGTFDSGTLSPDATFTYVADTEGTFAFTCTIHPSMTGTLTVGEADAGAAAPTTSPARIVAEDQTSDGSTVVVAEVELPTAGYVVVHADADGSPGPVIGHSDLLQAGVSTDVTVTLDQPLTATATVFPMAHVDADGDGVYEFAPPDETTDVPATTADGEVAVVGIEVTVG